MHQKALCLLKELPFLEGADQKLRDFRAFVQLGYLLHYPYKVLDVLGILLFREQFKDLI